jgi:mitochondrial fission protein ELM1
LRQQIIAWAVTTGEAGMRTQVRGLAQAVAGTVVEKTVGLRAPWAWVPQSLVPRPLSRLDAAKDRLAPPWPDLIITCGRRSAALSLAAKRASGGRLMSVHIQDPRLPARAFDLVVALEHDPVRAGPHVLKTMTAMHDVTLEALAQAAESWRERLAPLGRPLVGVAIGGTTRRRAFTVEDGARLIAGLKRLRGVGGAALAITPSRRTPQEIRGLLAEAFSDDPQVFLWNLEGENPYRGILALADRLVVTGDSVSMVSEALATPHPVEVFDLDAGPQRAFLQGLIDRRLVRRFEGDPTPSEAGGPIDATARVAEVLERMLRERLG